MILPRWQSANVTIAKIIIILFLTAYRNDDILYNQETMNYLLVRALILRRDNVASNLLLLRDSIEQGFPYTATIQMYCAFPIIIIIMSRSSTTALW